MALRIAPKDLVIRVELMVDLDVEPRAERLIGCRRNQILVLALAYGLAGLGYRVTATFLPVIARQALPGSPFAALFCTRVGWGRRGGAR